MNWFDKVEAEVSYEMWNFVLLAFKCLKRKTRNTLKI